jgi:RHS repeat-associated protein
MSKVQPDGVPNTFSYLSNGLIENQIDKNGNRHDYSYEPTYELKQHQVKDPTGEVVYGRNFTYDDVTRLVMNESNSESESISYTFDKWNRPETFTTVNRTYTLRYDDYDRMKSLQYPEGHIVSYAYDDINRMKSVSSPKMGMVDYKYELSTDSHEYTIQYPNNMKQQKTSDSFGEINEVNHFSDSETSSWSETYGYDGFGNIETINKNGKPYNFEYDGLNRISKETSVAETSSYTYDPKGNRQTLQTTKVFQVPTSEYSFNAVNQLTSFTMEDGQQGSFTYYPNGLRATKTTDNETTRYIYLNGVVIEELDGKGNVKAQNIWGNELLHRSVTGGKNGYYFFNGHGDVIEIKDGNGNTLNQYDFDIWGNIVSEKEDPEMSNPFLYSGEIYDSETGLYYLRARYYDPSIGRFISEDSYEGNINNPLSLNLYSYTYDNPLRYTDPSGNCPACIPLLIWGAEIILAATLTTATVFGTIDLAGKALRGDVTKSELAVEAALLTPVGKFTKWTSKGLKSFLNSNKNNLVRVLDGMRKGGHIEDLHVSLSNNDLIKRANGTNPITGKAEDIVDATTFTSLSVANKSISQNLSGNSEQIAKWLNGDGNLLVSSYNHGNSIGKGVKQGGKNMVYGLDTSVVILQKNASSPTGFIVLTAYPKL